MSTARRKSICTRDIAAGPGSCWYWWEGCPDRIHDCDARQRRAFAEGAQAAARELGLEGRTPP